MMENKMESLEKELAEVRAQLTEAAQKELERNIEHAKNPIEALIQGIRSQYEFIAKLKGTAAFDFFEKAIVFRAGRLYIDKEMQHYPLLDVKAQFNGRTVNCCQSNIFHDKDVKPGGYTVVVVVLPEGHE